MTILGNIGPAGLLCIFGAALIIFGPEEIPHLAKSAGNVIKEGKKLMGTVNGQITSEVQEITENVTKMIEEGKIDDL